MINLRIVSILSIVLLVPAMPAIARDCQKMVVTSTDGYANIRSRPQVTPDNIVATWYSGGAISTVKKYRGWWQIRQPVSGWISASQVRRVTCQSARNVLDRSGHPTIKRLSRGTIAGDVKAAEILIKMSRNLDGETAEIYAEAVGNWAKKNPRFLLSQLPKQPKYIRRSVLAMVDFSLGSQQSLERQQFESAIGKLSSNNPIGVDWQAIKR